MMNTDQLWQTANTGKPSVREYDTKGVSSAGSQAGNTLHVAKILVPVDFSTHSRKAFAYALSLATTLGAEITLLHVMEMVETPVHWKNAIIAADFEHNRKTLERELAVWPEGATVKCQSEVRLGRIWREIVNFAQVQDADFIVIATHGYTGLKHTLLGSVAEKVVRHATCPVLVVRATEEENPPAIGSQAPPPKN